MSWVSETTKAPVDNVRQFAVILFIAFGCAGCGRFFAAIPRHTEIERPVTAQEVAGHWLLTTNSVQSAMVDGFIAKKGEEVAITVRSNGSYSCHFISPRHDASRRVDRDDDEGSWSLSYESKEHFKNKLVLSSDRSGISSLYIGLNSDRMVLWTYWGDPDDCIDLVFEKVREE